MNTSFVVTRFGCIVAPLPATLVLAGVAVQSSTLDNFDEKSPFLKSEIVLLELEKS